MRNRRFKSKQGMPFNMIISRIKSVIDGRAMDGVTSFRIHSGPDMTQVRTGPCLSI